MSKPIEALVKPHMLEWARRKSGFDLIGAAKRIGVSSERLLSWEKGDIRPTINQAIKIAEVYKRPLSLFYLNETPKDFSASTTDFRRFPNIGSQFSSPALIWEQRQAETRRSLMLVFSENSEVGRFQYIDAISLNDDPEKAATAVRSWLGIDWTTQLQWRDPNEAINGWKQAIERQNVLVFHTNHQGLTLDESEARGFVISSSRFPIIVLNSSDPPRARIFTLLHEFAHLLLNTAGVCDCWEHFNTQTHEHRIEVFCNRIAGTILVPASILLTHEIVQSHKKLDTWSNDEIRQLADDFVTSREVILRRLLILGLATQAYYERKRAEYIEAYLESKNKKKVQNGFAPYFRLVLRRNGKPFTRHVLNSYYEKQITLADVADYLGAKIRDIRKIETEIFSKP